MLAKQKYSKQQLFQNIYIPSNLYRFFDEWLGTIKYKHENRFLQGCTKLNVTNCMNFWDILSYNNLHVYHMDVVWSSKNMGIFVLVRSLSCTVCLIIQIMASWTENKRVTAIKDVAFMKSGTEYKRIIDSSPKGVLRALIDIHLHMQIDPKRIVTEKLFENVVTMWIHQWKTEIYNRRELKYTIHEQKFIDQNNSSRVIPIREYRLHNHENEDIEQDIGSRIVLLTSEKMKNWITTSEINFKSWDPYFTFVDIIIGTCLPKYIINKPGIIMIIPVQTQYWIYPYNSKNIPRHLVNKRDNVPYLVQRQRATSLQCHMNFCHMNIQTRNLYGVLQHVSIGLVKTAIKNVLRNAIENDIKPEQFAETFLKHVLGYLKMKWYWMMILSDWDIPRIITLDHNWHPHSPTIYADISANDKKHKWPQLYRDGLTVLTKMKSRDMTLSRLVSILKFRVWIATIVTLLLFNLGFYFLFDGSPSIRLHPQVKNKSMSKVMRILFFDSLIRFQGDCQEGLTKSIRVLLISFNTYVFLILTAFLALFSVQILSRRYFPLNKVSDICDDPKVFYMELDVLSAVGVISDMPDECVGRIMQYKFRFVKEILINSLGCLSRDSCIILTHYKKGSLALNADPEVSLLKNPESVSEMSMNFHTGAVFKNSFSQLTLGLRENGILQMLHDRDFKIFRRNGLVEEAIKFSETWLTISILAIGIFAAMLILIAEKMIPNN